MADLQVIPLRNNLFKDWQIVEIKNKIINRINELHINNSKYRTDQEFLILICNLIEHLVNKTYSIDKKELAIEIFISLFDISIEEQNKLRNDIDIIHLKKEIKKVSVWKLYRTGFAEWFKKKP